MCSFQTWNVRLARCWDRLIILLERREKRYCQELFTLMAMASWGCPLPDAWAHFYTSLLCHSLHTPMNLSVPHLCFDTMVRALLSPPWLDPRAPSGKPFLQSTHSTYHSGAQALATVTANTNSHGGDIFSEHLIFFQTSSWRFLTPQGSAVFCKTGVPQPDTTVWRAILYKLEKNTAMHLL